jgi:hypothetical protein
MLHGLNCEWRSALGFLEAPVRLALREPLLRLGEGKCEWGRWSRDKREIVLSRHLLRHHPWDAVREVLLHEMAHQLADEVLGADGETPHGPSFQQACRMLGANPRASGSYAPLDERIFTGVTGNGHPLLARVQKLLALARGGEAHEAAAARAKAQQLVAKHQLEQFATEGERELATMFLGRPALRHGSERYALAHLMQDFYGVRAIWVPAYVVERGRMGRVLEVSGTLEHLRVADYVHGVVERTIDSHWQAFRRAHPKHRRRRSDFAVGVIEGFRGRLAGGPRHGGENGCSALVPAEDPRLEEYFARRYPRTVSIRRGGGGRDERVREAGRRFGQELAIPRGISDVHNSGKRLPGP